MSSQIPKGSFPRGSTRLHADSELGLKSLNDAVTSYTPADASNWASPAPATMLEAVQRLEAAVQGLLGGEIP